MEKYLIALDLDGTLLSNWEAISDKTKKYLKKLSKEGHSIVIATGRPHKSSEAFYDDLGLKTPMINFNGALVSNKHDQSFAPRSIDLPKEFIIDIFNSTKDVIENAYSEMGNHIYLYKDTEKIRPLLHYFEGVNLTVGPINDILDINPNGFMMIAKEGKSHIIEDYIARNYKDKVLSRNWGEFYNHVIELYTPKTSKGSALKYVAEQLGFERDNIIAFGDAKNDIDMIQFAGCGVAMKNAQEELKNKADFVTEYSNSEDGIVHFLEEYFKTKDN